MQIFRKNERKKLFPNCNISNYNFDTSVILL